LLGPSIINYVSAASPLIKWLVNVVLLSLIIYLAIRFLGDVLMAQANRVLKAVGSVLIGVVAPVLLAYLFLSGTLTVIQGIIHFNRLPSAFAALFIIVVGAVIVNYGSGFGEPIRGSLMYVGTSIILYGVAGLVAIAYAPLGTPFLYASIGSALMGIAMLISLHPSLRYLAGDLSSVAKLVVALLFVVGVMAMLAQIPQLRPYSGYLSMVSIILLVIVVAVIGYRLYSAFSRVAESIAERIYEQHVRESPLLTSSEDDAFANAVDEFMRHGRKEGLIAYAAYALAHCDLDFTEVSSALKGLIDYEPRQYGGMWPWEKGDVIEKATKDAELRRQLVMELMKAITECKVTKPEAQR
ncbi:MAG: hypothetical protein ACP5NQ_09795, partial [Vulcanisaeta sp.]